jgi:hypothetical protein
MRATHHYPWTVLAGLLFAAPCLAAEPFPDLVRRVPDTANALVLIDAKALHATPVGARIGSAKGSLAVGGGLSPNIDRLVVAALISPTTLDHAWKIGIASTRIPVTPDQLAKAEGGVADTVAFHPAVLSPRNAYYTILAPQLVGAMHPANRQALAKWVQSYAAARGPSKYLADAAAAADAPILLAVDLADVFDPPGLKAKLGRMKALAGRSDLPRIAQAIAGLKGARLAVTAGDTFAGELRLDGDGADALAPVAKALVLEAMEGMRLDVDDMDAWTARPAGGSVVLSGPLSEAGLRLLLSPLLSPTMAPSAPAATAAAAPAGDPKAQAAASQRYFRSVKALLDDLHGQKGKTFTAAAQAYQKYAQQIDELPILGVDPELLKWGGDVAVTLRGLAGLAKATGSQNRQIAMNLGSTPVTNTGTYNATDGWGYQYGVQQTVTTEVSNVNQLTGLMAAGGANEAAVRAQTWNNIDTATARVRRTMTEKYQAEF